MKPVDLDRIIGTATHRFGVVTVEEHEFQSMIHELRLRREAKWRTVMSDDRFTMTEQQRREWLTDNVEWHDLARNSDAEDDLATILDLLHKGDIDSATDYKDEMVRSYVQWRIDSES